jgi:hypothetical protein
MGLSMPTFPEMAVARVEEWEIAGVVQEGVLFMATSTIRGEDAKAVVQIRHEQVRHIGPGVPDFVARDLHRELKKLADAGA